MGNFLDTMNLATAAAGERILAGMPAVIEALGLLLAGWVLAHLLRLLTTRAASLLDTMVSKAVGHARWRLGRFANLLGTLVYWAVLLMFVTAATQALGLQTFNLWLARLLEHLPTLAAGLLIMVAGFLLFFLVAELVRATATALAAPQRVALARVAQGATLVVALLVGADQIGLKVTWLAIVVVALLVCGLGGLAFAISLGARSYVANLIGAHYLDQALRPGQRVRVAGHEGHIVDVTATTLILETSEGRVMLPGSVYHEQAIVVMAREEGP